ncbi:MAG: DUF5667 domain-containing protein [Patescibacteria group bacterium]|nr:DUF5667 domain-containing protein [Patescibacteria group bacterium]
MERNLIKKIRKFRKIQPRNDWVVLTKKRILGDENYKSFNFKPSFSFVAPALIAVFIITGVCIVSQNSKPGEPLHSIEKISETTQGTFVKENNKQEYYLNLAEKRVKELKEIADKNETKKLASAIQETNESIEKATQEFQTVNNLDQLSRMVKQVVNINKDIDEVEKVLGAKIGKETGQLTDIATLTVKKEYKNGIGKIIEAWEEQINSLNKDVAQKQEMEKMLKQVKQCYDDMDYAGATDILEKIYLLYLNINNVNNL